MITMSIFSLCVHSHIHLEPEWIPRELNECADFLRRIVDVDDWMLNPSVFLQIDAEWGPHTLDCFASCDNAQLPHFNPLPPIVAFWLHSRPPPIVAFWQHFRLRLSMTN